MTVCVCLFLIRDEIAGPCTWFTARLPIPSLHLRRYTVWTAQAALRCQGDHLGSSSRSRGSECWATTCDHIIRILFLVPLIITLSSEHEIEQFEDDPLEYVRLDLSLPSVGPGGADTTTRRQAAADVLQALVNSGYESETTEIVGTWISTGLTEYNANRSENWKAKDSAIYLLTAVATRGSTTLVRIRWNPLDVIMTLCLIFLAWCYVDKCVG
jgi:hypothetical protein